MATAGDYVDIVKLGWGTSYVTQNLREKLALYRSLGIPVICGGTLLEIAEVRGKLDGYRSWLSENGFESVEVSDGTIDLPRERKLEIIETLAQDFRVLSEVGSKDAEAIFAPYQWVEWIREELAAGAWKVITEARESGTAGIFRGSGEVRSGLIDEIVHELPRRAAALRGAAEVAAGLVHPAVRPRGQPRQHPARRGHPARDATARAAVRHDERIAARRQSLIDLHCHSSASDGLLTPTALVEHAHALGLRTLALTDHDTLGGLAEAAAAAERLGLRFVPGSELSVRPPSGSMHLLAYLPSAGAEPLATRIREIGDYRATPQPADRRAAQRARLSRSSGRTSRAARAAGSAGRTSPRRSSTPGTSRRPRRPSTACSPTASRPTSTPARSGRRRRSSSSPRAAARRCSRIRTRCAWATPRSSASSRASPGTACGAWSAIRPDHDDEQRAFTLRLCAQLGLVPTGGSDWHGIPDGPELGDAGPVPLPEDTLERLGLA